MEHRVLSNQQTAMSSHNSPKSNQSETNWETAQRSGHTSTYPPNGNISNSNQTTNSGFKPTLP